MGNSKNEAADSAAHPQRPVHVPGPQPCAPDRRPASQGVGAADAEPPGTGPSARAQQFETLGKLAGGIAHDFNNLLASILGNTSLALSRLTPGTPEHRALMQVEASAETAASLTRQMLACSGKGRFVVEPVDVSSLIEEIRDLIAASISKHARLELHTPRGLPRVMADASQLRQLVMNLVANASEALHDNPGRISISTRALQAEGDSLASPCLDEALPAGCYVEIAVSDTGAGMDAVTRDRMFDPFFTTKTRGHGLGLPAIVGIVRSHKGALQVESEPGQGTTIRVRLPAVDGECGCADATDAAPVPPRRTSRVLVVDDEDAVREFIQTALELHGYEVETADDGDIAVQRFESDPDGFDLVILDMTMPRMSGVDTFHALRCLRPDIRILLTSGYNQADATSHFTADGRAAFIQKPYRLARLLRQVEELLPAR